MAKDKVRKKEIVNRRATYEFAFLQTFEAGIMLQGTEVKAIREGNANLSDAYCAFTGDELYIRNLHVSEYKFGSHNNHDSRRVRKLLLKRAELAKLFKRVSEKGLTIVPYKLYFSDTGLLKVEIALAQGKKSFDKRETIKERDNKRTMDQLKKIKL